MEVWSMHVLQACSIQVLQGTVIRSVTCCPADNPTSSDAPHDSGRAWHSIHSRSDQRLLPAFPCPRLLRQPASRKRSLCRIVPPSHCPPHAPRRPLRGAGCVFASASASTPLLTAAHPWPAPAGFGVDASPVAGRRCIGVHVARAVCGQPCVSPTPHNIIHPPTHPPTPPSHLPRPATLSMVP